MIRNKPFRYFNRTRRLVGTLATAAGLLSTSAFADLSFTPLTISNARETQQSINQRQLRLSFQPTQNVLSSAQQKGLTELLRQSSMAQLQHQQAQQQRRLIVTIAVWPDQTPEQQQSNMGQVQLVERRLDLIKQYLSSQNFMLSFDGEYNMASQTSDLWSVERNSGRPSEALVIIRLD